MPDKLSFNRVFRALEDAINVTHQRHNLISSNISNLETPNKKGMDIDFKKAMARAMASEREIDLNRTHSEHIGPKKNSTQHAEPFEDPGEWNGYNWINIDREMTKLIENNLQYRTATEVLLRKIAIMKEVIRGGR